MIHELFFAHETSSAFVTVVWLDPRVNDLVLAKIAHVPEGLATRRVRTLERPLPRVRALMHLRVLRALESFGAEAAGVVAALLVDTYLVGVAQAFGEKHGGTQVALDGSFAIRVMQLSDVQSQFPSGSETLWAITMNRRTLNVVIKALPRPQALCAASGYAQLD